jgi:hypothetical protein
MPLPHDRAYTLGLAAISRMHLYLSLLLCLLVGSCVLPEPWESPEAIAAAQAQGRTPGTIRVGDPKEYVRLQWGPPNDIDTHIYGDTTTEWWSWCTAGERYGNMPYHRCYEWGLSVHFRDGRVESVHQ